MKAKITILIAVSLTVLLVASLASACGGSEEDSSNGRGRTGDGG